ncbi:MAG: 2-oxoglutarate synthase subunit alpha [Candidatus Handelsmanbacteria bacterium RIFCSPLOWO2_12_FULL_64_10]|uniref:2-oxoglutarate synthase subunit alpha n=1 Tax=Handelsmanbacteria sp. (strain RIFCSPLOWO2_12_FULL_64_10) TaxID=1817868 RepID=A0A1F6D419_HANXR|nr:MAG: 2-oxoglutarate synthase subunit alpha [Candidatus Handelsmanbacteria bacterium RIFCSPLOWO2_12_FULL_64_10]
MTESPSSTNQFMNGDIACAEGALAAGCRLFAGYPITPSTEIAEHLARRLPDVGGVFVQMEDELASMAAVLGGSWGGARAMTATSGPGFSLMQENIGWGMFTETPCVVVDIQRGSPSTGLPTLTSQSDVMQAKWGSHGDYEPVAYAPASPQEMFDLTIRAFNVADRLRQPVFIMSDETVGHMTELVRVAAPGSVPREGRPRPAEPPGDGYLPFRAGADLVPPMVHAGEGYRIHITGLTHTDNGYPSNSAAVHDTLVRRLSAKVLQHAPDLVAVEHLATEDAEVVVVAYGGTSRSARLAVRNARESGIRCGMLRLIGLWPFPSEEIAALGRRANLLVAEGNLGQMAREVERFTDRPVRRVNHGGGHLLLPEVILDAIKEAV